jgi:amino acid transporter
MKFASLRRKNPFDNPFLAWLVHAVTAAVACVAVYYSLTEASLMPLYFGGGAIVALEVLWLYFRLR